MNAAGWRELDAELRPFIARRVAASDVDDVLQEVLVRIQRGLASVREEERFGAWVHQVARSAVIDHRRRAARHPLAPEPAHDEVDEACPEPDDAEREVVAFIAPFVAMLPSPYREALTLTELEGLTQKEAAEMVGVSLSGMKSRVQRGRRLLREALEDCCRFGVDARGRVISWEPRPDGKLPDSCCS